MLIRYADDFVVVFQYRDDAYTTKPRVLRALCVCRVAQAQMLYEGLEILI